MKKVLIIQQIVPKYRKDFFELLKLELAKEDVELSLIYGNKSSSFKSDGFCEVNWGKFIKNKTIKLGKIELCWQPVIQYLKDKDLIIVEQANKLVLNYFLMITKHFFRNKLGFWGHGRNLQSNANGLSSRFSRLLLKKSDWWWAYTKGVKEYLCKNNYPERKITVVQNAINTVKLRKQVKHIEEVQVQTLKDSLGISGDKIGIFCGSFYPEKRIDFILESCFIIKKELPDFHMLFIGSGLEAQKVKNAASLNKWIHYLGPQTGQERVQYFKIASIQLMPGAVGLGILDSFALETPIITTCDKFHGPEIEYLQNGENGIITQNSLEIYSQTIIETLRSGKYLQLITGCIDSANIYTIEKMTENFKNGILSALNIE